MLNCNVKKCQNVLAGLTTELFLRYIDGCFGFALLGALLLGDPYIDVLSSRIKKSEFFQSPNYC